MFGTGMLEFAVILLVGFVLVFLLGTRRSDSGSAPDLPDAASDMTLNCPSCGQETAAASAVCQHCEVDL